jgi:Protein of unknown function (DUF2490)
VRFRFCSVSICLFFSLLARPVAAQAAFRHSFQGTDFQSWDELDAMTSLSSYLDVTWIARGVFSANLPNPDIYVFGTDWNFSIGKYMVITPSYRYFGFHPASGALGHGQSPLLAVMPRLSRGRLTLSDQNRFAGRFGTNGIGPSWVYRNRPEIDYRIGPSRWGTSLFVWDEVYHFSKPAGWPKNRVAAGGREAFNERLAANVYYQREHDVRGKPADINTIALLMEVRIK